MKNFLSNLCSSSRTDRVRTLAIDAVSLPSFCRVNMLKLVSVLVILLTLGVGNAWGAPYFTDNFSNVGNNTSGMSSRDGWESATRVYNHYNSAIRLASGSNTGTITKTAMTGIGASPTAIVLRFAAKSWNTDGSELNIVVNNAGTANNTNFILRKETSTTSSFSFTEEDYFEVIISNATSSTTITFNAASGKRVFLGDVSIYPYESEGKYVLVEDNGDIEAGDYLIVYNNANALNKRNSGNWDTNQYGSYTSISSYYTSSTKSIASNTTTDGLAYHVKATTNGYYIRKKSSGGFLGYASSSTNTGNYLQWNRELTTNQNEWTLGVNSIVSVKNTSCAIRWNSGFKIYAPANQSAVQLFKKVTCTGINPSVTYTSTTIYKGDITSAPTITGNTGSAGITWTSTNADVATVSSTGVVTALKAGTTTIKASFAASGDYCAKDVSINFTVRYRVKWSVNGDDSYEAGSPSLYVEAHNGKIATFPTSPGKSACDGSKEFVGWTATPIVGTTDSKPTFVSPQTGITDNTTLYAVFATRTANSYSLGDIDDLVNGKNVIVYNANQDKAMASSIQATGKLDGLSVTFSSTNITSPDASLIWTITNSGEKYIFKNSSGNYLRVTSSTGNTKLTCDGTSDTWTITYVSANTYTLYSTAGTSSRPLEAYFSSPNYFFTSYNGSGANYNMKFYVPTYTAYATTCCTKLGSINGSITLTQSSNSVTVKGWTYTQGSGAAESNIDTYDVYLYSDADSYADPISTQTCEYNEKSTGVTFTGLSYARTYKIKIGATGNTNYCDITPVQVTTINEVSTQTFQLACEDAGLAYGTGSVTKTFGNDDFTNPLTNSHNVNVSYTVTSASPAGCVTVNSSGLVHIVSAGTATINATSTEQTVSSVKYCADNASYTLTVNKANISPSLSYSSTSLTTGDDSSNPTISGNTGSGSVSYAVTSATPAGCVTVDAGTGVVTAVAAGSATITATIGATANYNGNTATASFTISAATYFTNGATVFIQADSKDNSAWKDDACVKAWFNASGAGGAAQTTYWLFDATDTDAGKKLFAAVVPASGDLNQVTVQRFAEGCGSFWNNNGTLTQASSGGVNTFRSYGSADNNVAWNGSSTILYLYGSQNSWASSLATFADQGSGVWTATFNNYAPDATSKDYKIKTSYNNGWIGNTGSNNNATLSDMIVGSTYNVTATLDVTDHSLVMSKTFVKGEVSFDLQGHGDAISKLTNVTAGSKISAPSEPSATGYTFGGWFKEPACTNEWTFASDEVEETMTLYAKWTIQTYSITKTFSNVANSSLPASFTYTGSTTTALNSSFTVNTTNFFLPSSIAVTMGGTPLTAGSDYTYNNSTGAFTFDIVITGDIVISASAIAKLKSIAITTQPTTRKYFAGESFSSAGAVVTATMGDGSTKAVTASATWTPPATPLAAGTGLTVTASYTENGINQSTTTTIDVYSVTVNKVNEDGDAVSADGVTATWTVGTKALAASASGASKYVFKQWEVTGATAASTSSANTTLSSPTANVVVNAVFWKPRTVKWSVNGNDSYNTGSPTTTVAYNGTISTIPTAPSGLVCASTFVAWTDAAHNNGTTAKASTSYYESKLFTAANQFPNITAETTTFYAVFAEGTGAAVNTVMWSEDWTGATTSDGTTGKDEAKPSAQGSHSGKTIYGGGSVTYEESSNATYVRNENTGGGTAPELMIKASEAFTISGIPSGGASELTLTYKRNNQALTPTVSGTDYSISYVSGSGKDTYTYTITCGSGTTFNLIFTAGSSNVRLDDVQVKVKTVNLTDYVTECDANIVSVTYDANSGSTSCMNTTTDKTEDFTVCSSAPTRDYYTFAGWLCSADSKTYAANATISAAAIDADFTLTAQWTPVTYTITYNYNGGSAQVDPVPATSYTVDQVFGSKFNYSIVYVNGEIIDNTYKFYENGLHGMRLSLMLMVR